MVFYFAFVLMFYSPYMCPKREYVEKRFDRVEVLSVEITCLCRLLIFADNNFHLIMGFK